MVKANKQFCLTFAGAVGSSKTPIANHLSYTFDLPIFEHDSIRKEVTEDLLEFNQEEFIKRREERAKKIVESGISFIFDASVDRLWDTFSKRLSDHGYNWFIISMDLSKEFLTKLYKVKGYYESLKELDRLFKEHEDFLANHAQDINVHITDENFSDRLKICENEFKKWLTKQS